MLKTKWTVSLLLCCGVLSACSPQEDAIRDRALAQQIADSLIFVKSTASGLCFGMTPTRGIAGLGLAQNGIKGPVLVQVSCQDVAAKLDQAKGATSGR